MILIFEDNEQNAMSVMQTYDIEAKADIGIVHSRGNHL